MQSVQRSPEISDKQWRAQETRRRRHKFFGSSSTVLMMGFVVGLYMFFVYNMQGFTFDTVALALYCAALTMFVIKCFTTRESNSSLD